MWRPHARACRAPDSSVGGGFLALARQHGRQQQRCRPGAHQQRLVHDQPVILQRHRGCQEIVGADGGAQRPGIQVDAVGPVAAQVLQDRLSTPVLRLYRTTDVTGAELGGALKNVIAIAAGTVIGAGLGDSARAAIITRGFAEMTRLAIHLGARPETLTGLSGLGDLTLTCTSAGSRNFRFGCAIGSGSAWDSATTVEGAATARALALMAARDGLDLPIAAMVARLAEGRVSVEKAMDHLLSRPLKEE